MNADGIESVAWILRRLFFALPTVGVVVGIPFLIWLSPRVGAWFRWCESALARVARRRWRAIAVSSAAPVVVCAALAWFVAVPEPTVHDEFSYLLAAETFSKGRAANPTHPMWVHFESFHIFHEPTYASKYPPGQGLFLAAGLVLTGLPIVGAWLSVGLACGAVCWMLMAWVPPRWALVGGLLAGFHPLVLSWGLNYWGGGVAMLGGALLVGGMGHLKREPRARFAISLAVGLALLAVSRPFEGLVLASIVSGALASWAYRRHPRNSRMLLTRIVLPVAAVMLAFAGALAAYNRAVTGDPFKMPYAVHEDLYGMAPFLFFLAPNETPEYRHPVIAGFHSGWEYGDYGRMQTPEGFVYATLVKVDKNLRAYFPVLIYLPLVITLPWLLVRVARARRLFVLLALFLTALVIETWLQAHYLAPAFCLFIALQVYAARLIYTLSWRGQALGRIFVRSALVWLIATPITFAVDYASLAHLTHLQWHRPRIVAWLDEQPGDDLVIVRYAEYHNVFDEWVYNSADIDAAGVVWARDMGDEANVRLVDYFAGRRVWQLEPDSASPAPVPYVPNLVVAAPRSGPSE